MSWRCSPAVRWPAGIVLCFVPMVCLYLSPWSSAAPLVYLGLLPAVVALECGPRVATVTSLLTPVSVFAGLLLGRSAWSAALFIGLICLGVAWSYTRRWQGAATYIVSQSALAAIAGPGTTLVDAPATSPISAAAVSSFVLLGGVWVAGIGYLLLYDLPQPTGEVPDRQHLYRFAIMLTALTFIGTIAAKLWLPGGHAWWVVLTVLVVLQPGRAGSTARTLQRVIGTVGGGFVAVAVVTVVADNSLTTAMGVLLAVLSGIAYLKAPYWAFAALLTAALMSLSFTPETVMHGYLERAGFTLLAAVAVGVVLWSTDLYLRKSSRMIRQHRSSAR